MAQRTIEIIHLPGLTKYEAALALQKERRAAVEEGRAENTLLLVEHAAVFTLGRNFHPENLLLGEEALAARDIAVSQADRGGDVTYHGPGQLVAYPILNLTQWKPSIRWYLRSLEQVLINQLRAYGLEAGREEGLTGVWVGGAKVAAIGIGLHNWVTYHGIALNVDPDMDLFRLIVPCGIFEKPVASLRQLLGTPPTMQQAIADFERAFLDYFVEWKENG